MVSCPSCGTNNPAGQRFCGGCGSPLGAPTAPAREERRVVTILFADLAGFTSRSAELDPEDVRAFLVPYYKTLAAEITGHGGTVERYLGDGVMALFGAPTAHEDDPDRAVRAALRILERVPALGLDLHARVGINTGDILFAAAGAGREDAVTGDPVNTAARLQALAPVDGVVVGEPTYRATARVFEYAELPPVTVKGRAQPIRVFHAIAPRARLGIDLTKTHDSPFVGREIDLSLLKGLFDKTMAAVSVQLVTVVGEAGIGKSRIVAELGAYVDARPVLVTWRQGRCLPYGEGISFWALGEIVKGHAGILDSDSPEVAAGKLEAVLPEGSERPWFRQRLLPLLGIGASSQGAREEFFAAWRRFLEHLAEERPSVLVFEDLHWADDALLDFLEHLADRAEGVPLLVVGTARPELFERHPDYANGLRNTTRINLAPLTRDETTRLIAALLESTAIPAEIQRPILDRAGGNPLYAEEFVRLLKDTNLLVKKGSNWELREGAEAPFPDSVHALIAARLDRLPTNTKSMLADAAVVGKVFWAGAVAHMGERDLAGVTATLSELSRKELVRPARRSSIEGEAEYAFWHVLARDVAYGQIPRATRASRHVAAARWIESTAPERVEDLADVLAYHYTTALELARAAGQAERARDLEAPALRFLSLAGERALGLDTTAAFASLERALVLAPPGHLERPEALTRFGEAALQAGRIAEAAAALEEAAASFQARGDLPASARAMLLLGRALRALGDPRTWTLPVEALAPLEALGPSLDLVAALTEVAASEAIQGRSEGGVRDAERALALAEELGLDRPARALGFRGLARANLGDTGGLADMREAIALAIQAGQGREVALLHNNLAMQLWVFDGPAAALEVQREGIGFARARGLTEMADATTASTLDPLVDAGELDDALEVAADVAERLEASGGMWDLIPVRAAQARIMALRGRAADVAGSLAWLESAARGTEDPHLVVLSLGSSALARVGIGQDEAAAALLAEVVAFPGTRDTPYYPAFLPAMVRTALAIGEPALAARLVVDFEPLYPYAEHALVAANAALTEASGDLRGASDAYAEAADRWGRFGVVSEEGRALVGQGRCLLGLLRPAEAAPVLHHAREIFERLGIAPALAEIDDLLKEVGGTHSQEPESEAGSRRAPGRSAPPGRLRRAQS